MSTDTHQERAKKEIMADEEAKSESEVAQKVEQEAAEEAQIEVEEKSLEEQLADAQALAAEYLDGWQRARAEFANARKRLERQRAEAYSLAAVDFATRLLPILDDFDRAMANVPEEVAGNSWFEGITLVRKKLHGILDGLGVKAIEASGKPFDPNLHEALSLVDSDSVESGIVVEELQTGYHIGERLIRPALVNVAA